MRKPYYVTTPIYYVNDRPHIGHCYSTLVADALARFHRLSGRDVFFLTGTDEHAEKVVESAAAHNVSPIAWADRNAAEFQRAFALMGFSNDDFVRTTQKRHTEKVEAYIRRLQESGDVYLGDYEGWWDASQEEYVTENTAREHAFKSPVTGRELVRRRERNYFFRLSKHQAWLREHVENNPGFVKPEARRNEVLGRLRAPEGLQDVPVSRAIDPKDPRSQWGIRMPGDPEHRVYVWIDALFNYLSVVDTAERRKWWPAQTHVMAKDILWFHAVIWPCMLRALGEALPECVYAHSFWIREGRKMSKSLGNFIDLETIGAYTDAFGVDALRWHLLTQGPLGSTDADFSHAKFVEVYNADLANGIGNAFSRVSNMIEKYFGGSVPEPGYNLQDARSVNQLEHEHAKEIEDLVQGATLNIKVAQGSFHNHDIVVALNQGVALATAVDSLIHRTEPFKLAKNAEHLPRVGTILYNSAEALRIAAVLLSPAMPGKMSEILRRLGQDPPRPNGSFSKPLSEVCAWGGLKPGTKIVKGEALFPRADPAAAAPGAAEKVE